MRNLRNLARNFLQVSPLMALVSIALFAIAPAQSASANSIVTSVPAVGAVLSQAPNAVSVTAASTLLTDGNSLSVTDPNNVQVDDGSLTITDSTAVVGLKPLTVTGIYTVSYTLLSATDDPLTGSYTFLYNAPASVTTPTAAPSPTPTANQVSKSASNAANIAVLVFVGLATIVALFLIWYANMIFRQYRRGRKKSRSKKATTTKADRGDRGAK